MLQKLINRYKIWKYEKSIRGLELQIMIFEIPYDIAMPKILWYEEQIQKLK